MLCQINCFDVTAVVYCVQFYANCGNISVVPHPQLPSTLCLILGRDDTMPNAREILRDRYLQLWLHVVQDTPHATIHLHGNTTVNAKLCSTDSENNRFRVDKLQAPLGTYDRAIIRGSDIDLIEWTTHRDSATS
ncbi:hypothetical protein V8B55DRAFT_1601392 [Mucor lusitanicus]|uniref:Uncharacterized protein n=2 Tax=Mucor circinelloides f. lusitanicus TaxID=29924 RepID=A0A168P6C9_MUCCL|nr:hypothetical protein FB192DRAFT_1346620 [Mucor lusitanicus]OAD07236.1 hypothetical protein MUCCIDRAFT_160821 [Mucor lusitanicus CBS 277.49]